MHFIIGLKFHGALSRDVLQRFRLLQGAAKLSDFRQLVDSVLFVSVCVNLVLMLTCARAGHVVRFVVVFGSRPGPLVSLVSVSVRVVTDYGDIQSAVGPDLAKPDAYGYVPNVARIHVQHTRLVEAAVLDFAEVFRWLRTDC